MTEEGARNRSTPAGASHPDRRRARNLLGLVGTLVFLLQTSAGVLSPEAAEGQPDPGTLGARVKAHFLLTFSRFTEWPPDLFAHPSQPLILCVFGEDPFGEILDETFKDRTVNGHPFGIRRLAETAGAQDCHVAFIGVTDPAHLRALLEAFRGARTLTVGEAEDFVRLGGILGLRLSDNLVQFQVNIDALKAARLQVSSKILRLGEVVRESGARLSR